MMAHLNSFECNLVDSYSMAELIETELRLAVMRAMKTSKIPMMVPVLYSHKFHQFVHSYCMLRSLQSLVQHMMSMTLFQSIALDRSCNCCMLCTLYCLVQHIFHMRWMCHTLFQCIALDSIRSCCMLCTLYCLAQYIVHKTMMST